MNYLISLGIFFQRLLIEISNWQYLTEALEALIVLTPIVVGAVATTKGFGFFAVRKSARYPSAIAKLYCKQFGLKYRDSFLFFRYKNKGPVIKPCHKLKKALGNPNLTEAYRLSLMTKFKADNQERLDKYLRRVLIVNSKLNKNNNNIDLTHGISLPTESYMSQFFGNAGETINLFKIMSEALPGFTSEKVNPSLEDLQQTIADKHYSLLGIVGLTPEQQKTATPTMLLSIINGDCPLEDVSFNKSLYNKKYADRIFGKSSTRPLANPYYFTPDGCLDEEKLAYPSCSSYIPPTDENKTKQTIVENKAKQTTNERSSVLPKDINNARSTKDYPENEIDAIIKYFGNNESDSDENRTN